jgi:hypothetical protein
VIPAIKNYVQINSRFKDSQVPARVAHVVPSVEDLAGRMQVREVLAGRGLEMTVGIRVIRRPVNRGCVVLVDNIAREVIARRIRATGDIRAVGLFEETLARATSVLEEERDIISSGAPVANEERVRASIKGSNFRVIEIGEIVCEAMDNDRARIDSVGSKTVRRCAADGLCETKGKETDAGHERENDGEQAHLLAPCPLLFRSADA